MLDTYQWLLVAMAVFVIALFFSLYLSDRYFGVSLLGDLVKKKEVDFITRKSLWVQRVIMYAMHAVILSFAAVWPIFVLGVQLLNDLFPFLLTIWSLTALLSLITFWGRDKNREAKAGS